MEQRIDYKKAKPEAVQPLFDIEKYLHQSTLEASLRELIKIRASQLNGCAFCIDMHTKDARFRGESEQRIYELNAWRETPFFSDRERAALAWTEAVTLVSETHVPDDVYDEARKQFSEQELMDLTLAVAAINAWNRLAIAFRAMPGTYQVQAAKMA